MPGYIQSPLSIIQQLRDNLHNRYRDEFCILKELVQNANDAGARRMAIGWAKQFPAVGHPLFAAPGIFVVNDGPVTDTDLQAVKHLGLSNKAADSGSVGKFGLEMKSVFHVCEAFLYIHRAENTLEADFLNPWAFPADWKGERSGLHQDWEESWARVHGEVARAFSRWLGPLAGDWDHWFALWLPLRTHRLCDKVAPILEKYP